MFKRKKKKTGIQTPEFRKPTPPPPIPRNPNCGYQPQYTSTQNPPMPPTSGSNAVQPSPPCTYSTPCGWCAKWDKKCDKKIPECGLRAKCNFIEDAIDSSDAMNVIDQAIDEVHLLENVIETTKHSDIDYVRFRKSVCAYCPDPNCMKSQVEICDCHKFESYY